MSNMIECGTCGYPLTPEERTGLVEHNGRMVKPEEVTDRDLLKQALEALENAEDQLPKPYSTDARAAITALRERLAQPEPVAWMWKDGTVTADPDRADGTWTPLYTAPQR